MSAQDITLAIFATFVAVIYVVSMLALRKEIRRHNVEIENIERVPIRVYATLVRRMDDIERKLKESENDESDD